MFLEFLSILQLPAILIACYMLGVFVTGTILKNNGIVDIAWGIGFVLVALVTYGVHASHTVPQILVTTLVSIWGIRLAYHIGKRNIGKPEDFRYAAWRAEWGKWVVVRSLLQVYLLQGFVMLLVCSSIIAVNSTMAASSPLVLVGALIWGVGFFFEAIGDWQLRRFVRYEKKNGDIMTKGLWRYTRHPNYFGEAVLWWGIWLISLSTSYGWYALVSPIVITYLVRFVSGVPMLEKKYHANPQYQAYKKQTNAFIPWLPRIS